MPEVYLVNPTKKKRRKTATKKKKVVRRAKKSPKKITSTTTTTSRRTVRAYAAPRRRKTTRRRATVAKGSETMAKKRRTTKRKKYTKNPAPRRRRTSYKRRAVSRVRSTFAGLNIKGALKNTPFYLVGMLGSKWISKRFGGGASEMDPESWTWRSYLQGAAGAVATAYIVNMFKRGSGQKVLEGGLSLLVYELIQNEFVAGSEWATEQFGLQGFGADDEDAYSYFPGDVETTPDGKTALLGQDYQWRELPEGDYGGSLEPVGPLGQLEPVGPLGSDDPYRNAILG